MVIDNFDIEGVAVLEAETHAPLVVDADAPHAFSVALQFFQAVLRGYPQILDTYRPMQHLQLALRDGLEVHEAGCGIAGKQGLRMRTFECLDHAGNHITRRVKRQWGCRNMGYPGYIYYFGERGAVLPGAALAYASPMAFQTV